MVVLLQVNPTAVETIAVHAERQGALKMFSFETTAGVCLAYLALGVASFRKARRRRNAEVAAAKIAVDNA